MNKLELDLIIATDEHNLLKGKSQSIGDYTTEKRKAFHRIMKVLHKRLKWIKNTLNRHLVMMGCN